MTLEWEFVRWMLLMIAAVALVLAVAAALGAADPLTAPQLLPNDMGVLARPMTPVAPRPFFPEGPPIRELPPAEAAEVLWQTLQHHRAGCVGEALAGWERLQLAEGAEHWRVLARGAAFLQAGDLKQAADHLLAARRIVPGHPLAAYLMGILRLEQAQAAERLPDALPRDFQRLVAYTPQGEGTALRMLAMEELNQAIATAHTIRLDQRLLAMDPRNEEAIVAPTVRDLLVALGADNFTGKAHHMLFALHLDAGDLADAEFHLDRAADTGLAVLYRY
jgi:tetratricopeptide (TPR) repeat protein